MDFTKLKTGAKPAAKKVADASVTTTPFTPMAGDKPFQNGGGEDLVLDLYVLTSPEGTREARKWGKKFNLAGLRGDHMDADEDELARLIEMEDGAQTEFLPRMIAGWNIVDAGKPVEATLDNKKGFLAAWGDAHDLTAQIDAELQRVAAEMGESKPG